MGNVPVPEHLEQFAALVEIIKKLRAPDGCPWDRKQTHATLKESLLEESYEVLDALDEEDTNKVRVELGDLLLQIVLHAQIGADNGEFNINDVIKSINKKLIHRHPHVFASGQAKDAEEVEHNWEILKKEEKGEDVSILESVPKQLPALTYGQVIQGRAARVGFDWPDVKGVIDKVDEEVKELQEAKSQEEKTAEFGDLLFSLVNLARRMDIDPEAALRQSNRKFYTRFTYIEEVCRKRGLQPTNLTLEELDALWKEAKGREDGR